MQHLDHFGAPQAKRSPRNQKFADSPAEGDGFELFVPPHESAGFPKARRGFVKFTFCAPGMVAYNIQIPMVSDSSSRPDFSLWLFKLTRPMGLLRPL